MSWLAKIEVQAPYPADASGRRDVGRRSQRAGIRRARGEYEEAVDIYACVVSERANLALGAGRSVDGRTRPCRRMSRLSSSGPTGARLGVRVLKSGKEGLDLFRDRPGRQPRSNLDERSATGYRPRAGVWQGWSGPSSTRARAQIDQINRATRWPARSSRRAMRCCVVADPGRWLLGTGRDGQSCMLPRPLYAMWKRELQQ